MNFAATIPFARRLNATVSAIGEGFRANALLHVFALLVCTAAVFESMWLGLPMDFKMVKFFIGPLTAMLLVALVVAGLGLEIIRLGRAGYRGSMAAAISSKLRDDYLAPQRVANGLHAFLFMTIYMAGYTFMKTAIPKAMPFSWDETFMRWDEALHFGMQPFEILAPLLNYPALTSALNFNYNMWFFVMFGCWFWQGFAPYDTALRQKYLLAFTLTWFIGSCILGLIFSSAGPCFYGKLVPGPNPYTPLMDWLYTAAKEHRIYSLRIMNALWKDYETGKGALSGISAMPSMHIATSMLFAFLAFEAGKRKLGVALSVFAFFIFIGSIHLGWHYAIDGYAGALVAVFGWWAAGKLVAWDRRRRGAG